MIEFHIHTIFPSLRFRVINVHHALLTWSLALLLCPHKLQSNLQRCFTADPVYMSCKNHILHLEFTISQHLVKSAAKTVRLTSKVAEFRTNLWRCFSFFFFFCLHIAYPKHWYLLLLNQSHFCHRFLKLLWSLELFIYCFLNHEIKFPLKKILTLSDYQHLQKGEMSSFNCFNG